MYAKTRTKKENKGLEFPVYIELGSLRLHPHPILEFAAYFAGARYYLRARKRLGDDIAASTRLGLFVWAAAGALLGARVLGLLEHPDFVAQSLNASPWRFILLLVASKTIVGGLLGGLVGVEIGKFFLGESRSTGDLYVRPLLLAMIIGRAGCFLSGMTDGTHGAPTDLPWGLDLGDGRPRHPAALYEIAFLILLWFVLSPGRDWVRGRRFQVFLASYLLFRLLIDNLKPIYRYGGILSAIQLACIAGLMYYSFLWLRERLRGRPE